MKNPTEYQAWVDVGYIGELTVKYVSSDMVLLPPGGSRTFDVPGAHCPCGVLEELWGTPAGHAVDLRDTSCLGHAVSTTGWTACCWNHLRGLPQVRHLGQLQGQ